MAVRALPAPRAGTTMHALLAGAIDYAGLFPPASLDLGTAVANYAGYRASADAWALGRFVIPAARLQELAEVASSHWERAAMAGDGGWRISALVGHDVVGDSARIARFNERYAAQAQVDSVEAVARDEAGIRRLAAEFAALQCFVELPLDDRLDALLSVVGETGVRAKVRTGGIVADAIPPARAVARFLVACARKGVAFKATAGLHHPIRGEYALTYEADSARGTMFGYLNVFAAAQRAREGASEDELVSILEARDSSTFADILDCGGDVPGEPGAAGDGVAAQSMSATRATFARSFGSCSFREPLDDLAALLQR